MSNFHNLKNRRKGRKNGAFPTAEQTFPVRLKMFILSLVYFV